MLGVGLLLPGLILAPAGEAAESASKPAAKHPDPKPRAAEKKAGAAPAAAKSPAKKKAASAKPVPSRPR